MVRCECLQSRSGRNSSQVSAPEDYTQQHEKADDAHQGKGKVFEGGTALADHVAHGELGVAGRFFGFRFFELFGHDSIAIAVGEN